MSGWQWGLWILAIGAALAWALVRGGRCCDGPLEGGCERDDARAALGQESAQPGYWPAQWRADERREA